MSVTVEDVIALKHGPVEYINVAGVIPEILDERHIRMSMPMGRLHINHVEIAYAGSLYIMIEVAARYLLSHSLGQEKMAQIKPVVKRMEVQFRRPCNTDFYVDATMPEEEVEKNWKTLVDNHLNGDVTVNLDVKNAEDKVVTIGKVTFSVTSK